MSVNSSVRFASSLKSLAVTTTSLTLLFSAQSAFAQNNDVDAYDGTVLAGCANATALTAAVTDGRFRNVVSGRQQCIANNARDNVVSGGFHTIGERAELNTVRGQQNTIGNFSSGNHVDGFTNVISNGGGGHFVFGSNNTVGFSSGNNIFGDRNTLLDSARNNFIIGERNTVNGGNADANFIAGERNTIGAGSDGNSILGHRAVVTGDHNFVGGGDFVSGPSVNGNNNVVIGTGASSVVDDGVAIGSNSAATLSIAASQAAWAGGTVGAVTFTEGTDAVGGEMNIGNRLLTGVADGRVASGSSDAVNGHQLFEAVNAAGGGGGTGDCGDGTGTDSHLCGDGASATGNQATALGDNASANFEGSVALGVGSATTMDIAAAQSAYSSITIGGLTLTEGTDATGGEMNIGNRLVTGVADGRVANGSSDAVNGHQLNEVASGLDGRITSNTNDITAIQGDVTTLQGDVTTLQGGVTAIQGGITTLQGDVTMLQTDVLGNTVAITANTAGVVANAGDIANNANDISANTTAIAGITTDFTDLTDRVETNEVTNDAQDVAIGVEATRNDNQDTAIAENVTSIAAETTRNDAQEIAINENAGRISDNSAAILGNGRLIADNQALIGRNYGLILDNAARIDKMAKGVAMSMSLPDAYLDRSESLAIAGGLGTFDGEVGFGAAITIRGNDKWSFSAGSALAGGEYGGKVSARWSR